MVQYPVCPGGIPLHLELSIAARLSLEGGGELNGTFLQIARNVTDLLFDE